MSDNGNAGPRQVWVPGHCMKRPGLEVQYPSCPVGSTWRKGFYRRVPPTEATHKFMNRFVRKLKHRLARHPNTCGPFLTLNEFHDCMRGVERSMQSFLLKTPAPTRSQIRQYTDYLIERVFYCTGTKLEQTCFFQPTTVARKYIENILKPHTNLD